MGLDTFPGCGDWSVSLGAESGMEPSPKMGESITAYLLDAGMAWPREWGTVVEGLDTRCGGLEGLACTGPGGRAGRGGAPASSRLFSSVTDIAASLGGESGAGVAGEAGSTDGGKTGATAGAAPS